jgi:hypothetical protein
MDAISGMLFRLSCGNDLDVVGSVRIDDTGGKSRNLLSLHRQPSFHQPFVKPLLKSTTSTLQSVSGEVIDNHDQYEVFNDPYAVRFPLLVE